MVRNAPATSALVLVAALSVANLSGAALEYKVRVRNLTYQQPFSPIVMLAHTSEIYAFQEDLEASEALKQLAETGDITSLTGLAEDEDVIPFLCGYAVGPDVLMPGDTERMTLMVDDEKCGDGALFSMASMLVNTNDAFVGVDSANLKRYKASKIYPPAFDAGTEENNELCSHIPGPACDPNSGNEEAGPGEGYVHIHRGFHGIGGELSSAGYDWKNPVAEVYIAKPTSV